MNQEERKLLESMALELDALHDDAKTDDRYRPGLRIASRRLRAALRGDSLPVVPEGTRNRAYVSAEVLFDGTYYDAGEIPTLCRSHIENALRGFKDVRSVDVQAIVRAVE